MSTPAVSPRTIIRDAVLDVLNTRRDKSTVRVQTFDISKKYLTTDQSKSGQTYCVIVSDEAPGAYTHARRHWSMELKIVCYAHHADDPHSIVDGMIEDVQEAMETVREHLISNQIASSVTPSSITSDERTTEAGPWGQAVCTWSIDHSRV